VLHVIGHPEIKDVAQYFEHKEGRVGYKVHTNKNVCTCAIMFCKCQMFYFYCQPWESIASDHSYQELYAGSLGNDLKSLQQKGMRKLCSHCKQAICM
jgi:uncharacterized Fe-S radical SAM superfamily protein PflX